MCTYIDLYLVIILAYSFSSLKHSSVGHRHVQLALDLQPCLGDVHGERDYRTTEDKSSCQIAMCAYLLTTFCH